MMLWTRLIIVEMKTPWLALVPRIMTTEIRLPKILINQMNIKSMSKLKIHTAAVGVKYSDLS